MRIVKHKLISLSGKHHEISLVRIGANDYEPPKEVKEWTLDYLVDKELGGGGDTIKIDYNKIDEIKEKVNRIDKIMQVSQWMRKENPEVKFADVHTKCKKEVQFLTNPMLPDEKNNFLLDSGWEARDKWMDTKKRDWLNEMNQLRTTNTAKNNRKSNVETVILKNSWIVCATLSMSGIEKVFTMGFKYSYLIIDEACQAVELATLIPFGHNPEWVILVGDQQQLPATTFAPNSDVTRYNWSLYERLLVQGVPHTMLSVQYWMHPEIRAFPSNQFYEGRITDGPNIS